MKKLLLLALGAVVLRQVAQCYAFEQWKDLFKTIAPKKLQKMMA